MAIKKRGPFDFVRDLTERKTKWEDLPEVDKKGFSPYIVTLFLSMNPDLIEFVNSLQKYTIGNLTPKHVYKLYLDFLPKMKLPYNKYIKGKTAEKYNKDLLNLLSKHFEVSIREIDDYLILLPQKRLIEIVSMYGKTQKEINKLIKIKK